MIGLEVLLIIALFLSFSIWGWANSLGCFWGCWEALEAHPYLQVMIATFRIVPWLEDC